ncbi:MAG: DNA repair protein RecN [Gammaproteobacteria bacterium]|nr:DNA repair protein RecN [Gammaproteobacteria bacterium]
MLIHLQVRDFAIIDAVEIELGGGLTVLTGETGAGKSILVDALQLAVGARAGAEAIRHGAERAEVAATFDLRRADPALRRLLEEQSIDADDELVVRRVVTREGKSRAYLNGQQVPIQVLREAGGLLAEIHGQHEFQSLLRSAAQRQLLDAYAGAETLAAEVAALHRERLARAAELTALEEAARDRDARLDLLRHQAGELDALALQPAELPALTAERSRLANSGRLAQAARGALEMLYEADSGSAHALAARAHAALRQAAALDARLDALLPGLEAAVIGLADASRELTRYLDGLESDPARQEAVETRLAAIEALSRKHRIAPDALPAKAEELRAELARLEGVEQALEGHREAVRTAGRRWREAAERLSKARRQAAQALGRDISARMQTLGMTGGRFESALHPLASADGTDSAPGGLEDVEFLVSANTGQPPRPLAKVASGGELSRLSLAVQVTLATRATADAGGPPSVCMVFDEVDSGVGGAVAEIVGRELAALGRRAQVLCVTHLPQVAALGSRHLRVSKLTDGQTTRTQITALQGPARIEEVARMLGGVSITATARGHAAEMLEAGAQAARGATVSRPAEPDGGGNPAGGSARRSRGRAR